jgi:hypothetical protein
MGNSKSGIETLLDDVDIFEVVVKEIARREFKREAAARGGKLVVLGIKGCVI